MLDDRFGLGLAADNVRLPMADIASGKTAKDRNGRGGRAPEALGRPLAPSRRCVDFLDMPTAQN
jgi:hypothetical protein